MPEYVVDPIAEVYRFTSVHPTFHALFKPCYEHLFNGSGYLCAWQRHYIALMAATRHRCLILMDYHTVMFRRCGGDEDWLAGITSADARFQSLDVFNRFMAHQPWMLNAAQIHGIVGKGTPDAVKTFALHELNEACLVLAQTHVFCSFICALGIERRGDLAPAELDFLNCDDIDYLRSKEEDNEMDEDSMGELESLVRRMMELETQANEQKEKEKFSNVDCAAGGESPERPAEEEDMGMPVYSRDPRFSYQDFQDRPDRGIRPFRIDEFSWDHAYNLISDLNPDSAYLFDNCFRHIQRLTYRFMGQHSLKIDTSRYREAVWNYIQGLYGIRYDDYDYSRVNVLIDKATKSFIKTAACFPHKLTTELAHVMSCFKTSEKIHVVIIVMEARLQAILLHFTRALCNYNAQMLAKNGYKRPLD
ncbi:unnamed protein product [Caenorhabditis bovis]|uniref:Sestrin n=1 Tax=Caenorhabditis bovis TaxID=2654633 RepID=A0A8S1F4Y4_9PELO|nr:unnamed protein product [Caenorhabditis bovis]